MAKKSGGKQRTGCGTFIIIGIIIVIIGAALSSKSTSTSPAPATATKVAPIVIDVATEKPRATATAKPRLVATSIPKSGGAAVAPEIPATVMPSVDCDPSYPDFCIPPSGPDLDCKDVLPHKRFRVLPPDRHGFDKDKNGLGCES